MGPHIVEIIPIKNVGHLRSMTTWPKSLAFPAATTSILVDELNHMELCPLALAELA